jgi:hypothetical protein
MEISSRHPYREERASGSFRIQTQDTDWVYSRLGYEHEDE